VDKNVKEMAHHEWLWMGKMRDCFHEHKRDLSSSQFSKCCLRDPFNVGTIPRYLHSLTDSSVAKTTHFKLSFWFLFDFIENDNLSLTIVDL